MSLQLSLLSHMTHHSSSLFLHHGNSSMYIQQLKFSSCFGKQSVRSLPNRGLYECVEDAGVFHNSEGFSTLVLDLCQSSELKKRILPWHFVQLCRDKTDGSQLKGTPASGHKLNYLLGTSRQLDFCPRTLICYQQNPVRNLRWNMQ